MVASTAAFHGNEEFLFELLNRPDVKIDLRRVVLEAVKGGRYGILDRLTTDKGMYFETPPSSVVKISLAYFFDFSIHHVSPEDKALYRIRMLGLLKYLDQRKVSYQRASADLLISALILTAEDSVEYLEEQHQPLADLVTTPDNVLHKVFMNQFKEGNPSFPALHFVLSRRPRLFHKSWFAILEKLFSSAKNVAILKLTWRVSQSKPSLCFSSI
jgi:hypothetical protein